MVSRLWFRLFNSDCKRPCPGNDNKFQRKSTSSLELVVVPKTIFFGQSFGPDPIHSQPGRTFQRKKEVPDRAGAQDMDNCGYDLSDLDYIELFWEKPLVEMGTVFALGIDTLFSPTAFDGLETGRSSENRMLLDEEEDKENSSPKTRLSDSLTELSRLLRSSPFDRF